MVKSKLDDGNVIPQSVKLSKVGKNKLDKLVELLKCTSADVMRQALDYYYDKEFQPKVGFQLDKGIPDDEIVYKLDRMDTDKPKLEIVKNKPTQDLQELLATKALQVKKGRSKPTSTTHNSNECFQCTMFGGPKNCDTHRIK